MEKNVEFEVEIPLYRAREYKTNNYIIGLLIGVDKENNICDIREIDSNDVSGHICYLDTLAISTSDMLDCNNRRIFASLNKSGKGGDMDLEYRNKAFVYKSQEIIPYYRSWDEYSVVDIQVD
jgi:hypothetical protein